MKQELSNRGLIVSHKRVGRLMREDNLLAIQRRKFVITTESRHELEVHLNVATHMRLTGINQLWVADITYIRLQGEFVYLAVVLDRFSRKVVGFALANHLEASLALQALDQALAARNPAPDSLIHHSDRGVQYACADYVGRLEARGVAISMSRPGNPYDNAKAESFMKTLKTEEVNGKAYANIEDARRQIAAFIETIYNGQRLHSALGYKPPVEFEAELRRRTRALPDGVELQVRGADRLVPRVVEAAEAGGFALADLSVAEPTLETVFIGLTGKELRD